MPDTKFPTGELGALFIQKSYGAKPAFRGFHSFTGGMTKNDGTRTPVYMWLAGEAVKVATQKANPEPVTVTMDAPLIAIADLVGTPQDCPIDLIVVTDNCLSPEQKRSWLRWGSTEPQITVLIPQAEIEQRGMENLISRDSQTPAMGNVQIKFDDWKILKGGNAMSLSSVAAGSTVTGVDTTHCSGCMDANCGGTTGCSEWYLAAANGKVYKSIDGGSNWTELTVASAWTAGNNIYADQRVILVGGNAGAAAAYGVQRSLDSGASFSKVTFATAASQKTGTINKIIRYIDDFYAFTDLGIWRSTNDGLSWSSVDATEGVLSGVMDDNGFGVAVTATALLVTTDGGLQWTALSGNPTGTAFKDVALAGGYVHVVDSAAGYFRSPIPDIKADQDNWTTMDTTASVTDILFCSRLMGYRLRGTSIDRTIDGGYSWQAISISGAAPTFAVMTTCAGRLATGGGVYFGYYDPYFTSSSYGGTGSDCGC